MQITAPTPNALLLMVILVVGLAAAASAQRTIPAPSDVAAVPSDAETTSSGLASKVVEPGTGSAHPGPTSTVTVHYSGWHTNGEMFDSSVARGQPSSFPLNRVIRGWTGNSWLRFVRNDRRTAD